MNGGKRAWSLVWLTKYPSLANSRGHGEIDWQAGSSESLRGKVSFSQSLSLSGNPTGLISSTLTNAQRQL